MENIVDKLTTFNKYLKQYEVWCSFTHVSRVV